MKIDIKKTTNFFLKNFKLNEFKRKFVQKIELGMTYKIPLLKDLKNKKVEKINLENLPSKKACIVFSKQSFVQYGSKLEEVDAFQNSDIEKKNKKELKKFFKKYYYCFFDMPVFQANMKKISFLKKNKRITPILVSQNIQDTISENKNEVFFELTPKMKQINFVFGSEKNTLIELEYNLEKILNFLSEKIPKALTNCHRLWVKKTMGPILKIC